MFILPPGPKNNRSPFVAIMILIVAGVIFAMATIGHSQPIGIDVNSAIGAPITNKTMQTITIGGWASPSLHDTAFERVKEIRQRCDTVVELESATDFQHNYVIGRRNGGAYKPIVVWVTIKCVADTTWEPRDDVKLTPQDIINLRRFLRGEWSPPENSIGWNPTIQYLWDRTLPAGLVRP